MSKSETHLITKKISSGRFIHSFAEIPEAVRSFFIRRWPWQLQMELLFQNGSQHCCWIIRMKRDNVELNEIGRARQVEDTHGSRSERSRYLSSFVTCLFWDGDCLKENQIGQLLIIFQRASPPLPPGSSRDARGQGRRLAWGVMAYSGIPVERNQPYRLLLPTLSCWPS